MELTRIAQQAQQSLMLLRLNSGKVIDRQRDDAAAKKVTLAQADLTKLMAMLDAATAVPATDRRSTPCVGTWRTTRRPTAKACN